MDLAIGTRVVLTASLVCLALPAARASEGPVAVSPGSATGTLIGDPCPTFSWGMIPDARDYVLVVYEVRTRGEAEEPKLLLEETLPGSVTSWTPSLDRCLDWGARYAWSVRARGTEVSSEWSPPNLFEVATSSRMPEHPFLDAGEREEAPEGSTRVVWEVEPTRLQSSGGVAPTRLRVSGGINAVELCDENGSNCMDLSAASGGGLQGLVTITNTTAPFDLPDSSFTDFIPATCPPSKLLLMGTCTDSQGALIEWGSGGSGPISQAFNSAPGTGYTCRSRNSTGGTLNDLTVTATAVCASLP